MGEVGCVSGLGRDKQSVPAQTGRDRNRMKKGPVVGAEFWEGDGGRSSLLREQFCVDPKTIQAKEGR